MDYIVEFECRFKTKVRCQRAELFDTIANLNVPEDKETRYVEDSFDPVEITDEMGNDVPLNEV